MTDPNDPRNPRPEDPDFDYETYHMNRMIDLDRVTERACKVNWIIALVVAFALLVAFCHGPAHGTVLACLRLPTTCEQVAACVQAVGPARAERLARKAGATEAQIEQGKSCVSQQVAQAPK